jgi:hypothetical protein
MKHAGRAIVQRSLGATRAATPAQGTKVTQRLKRLRMAPLPRDRRRTWLVSQRDGLRDTWGQTEVRSVDDGTGLVIDGSTWRAMAVNGPLTTSAKSRNHILHAYYVSEL